MGGQFVKDVFDQLGVAQIACAGPELRQECRAEISEDMTAREIAEAQRQARAWLNETTRRAA